MTRKYRVSCDAWRGLASERGLTFWDVNPENWEQVDERSMLQDRGEAFKGAKMPLKPTCVAFQRSLFKRFGVLLLSHHLVDQSLFDSTPGWQVVGLERCNPAHARH